MKDSLSKVYNDLLNDSKDIKTLKDLYAFKIKALGKKSELYSFSRKIGSLSPDEKKEFGILINTYKKDLNEKINNLEESLKNIELENKLKNESIDISLPSNYLKLGSLHPVTKITHRVVDIFKQIGFTVESGPELEHDFYCFEALNIPKDHPARDMQDTFYINENTVLRTHTSPVQIRTMLRDKPPIRILAPGKVYRSDYDVSHTPMFHQIEGLVVDRDVSFSDLKGTLMYFAKQLFGAETDIRLRPSYFPFTEPSCEMDLTCVNCKGKGCRVCKNTGWLEIMGCGMVHPNVFSHVGYSGFTGFAFGMGIERIAMLKYGIDDIRLLFENDLRFLSQF